MRSEHRAHRVTAEEVIQAINVLRDGGVIAIPTDTVYGLAAALHHVEAIERLFEIKGRPNERAIPVLVGSSLVPKRLTHNWSNIAGALAEAFWPGALTIVVEANESVPAAVRRGGSTVGIRMPNDAVALEIIQGAGGALAVTSANKSGERECRTAGEVTDALRDTLDYVVSAGVTAGGAASTVIDVTVDPPAILREGPVDREQLWRVVDSVSP